MTAKRNSRMLAVAGRGLCPPSPHQEELKRLQEEGAVRASRSTFIACRPIVAGRVSPLLKRVGFCIWVPGCPISRREGYLPEHRIGQHEFHSHLRVLALTSGYLGPNTFQFPPCLDGRQK